MISVALATYNGEKYIAEQLRSIWNQTKQVDEIVVTDDCSTDDTVAIIQEFVNEYPECKVRLYENETNLGYKANFKKAISLCEGDMIFLSDQDDVWKPEKVEVLAEVLAEREEVSLISTSFDQIDSDGEIVAANKDLYKRGLVDEQLIAVPLEDLIFHNISQGCAMAFKKDIKELFENCFTENLPHDWILNVVAAMQKKCYFIKRALFSYRVHEKNTTGVNDDLTLQRKNTLDMRMFDAKQAICVLDLIERADGTFYRNHHSLKKMKEFAQKHLEYLKTRNLKGILLQNFDSTYKRLKSVRGRMLDIYFVMKKQ